MSWVLTHGSHRPFYRFERTARPEEERTSDPFRSIRPHTEDAILGTSRWTTHTAGYRFHAGTVADQLEIEPFIEGTVGGLAKVGDGIFEVNSYYQDSTFWSLTAGLRMAIGLRGHRMGRYGLADRMPGSTGPGDHHED